MPKNVVTKRLKKLNMTPESQAYNINFKVLYYPETAIFVVSSFSLSLMGGNLVLRNQTGRIH
jgi:hypothetical protein